MRFKLKKGLTSYDLIKYYSKGVKRKLMALNAFFSLVEHRLDIMLFRSNFATSMREARQFINHKHVLVNGGIISHTNYILENFDMVSLDHKVKKTILKKLLNISKLKVALYPPRYIYVDYTLLLSCIIFNPMNTQVPFPFSIDLKKWLGLAKHTL